MNIDQHLWLVEAAKELASHFSFGGGKDSYVTDEQRANVAHNYLTILIRHYPFDAHRGVHAGAEMRWVQALEFDSRRERSWQLLEALYAR